MSAPPLVSVIVPTLNRGALLREAIASVLAQTFAHYELLVVDDGSTDGTREFLAAHPDSRLRPLLLPPLAQGPASNRNAGAAEARGRYLAFLDDDDLWLPVKLERQLAALQAAPEARWSATDFAMFEDRDEVRVPRVGGGRVVPSGWVFDDLIRERGSAAMQTVLVERTLFVEAGGFDVALRHREDFDLALRLAERAPLMSVVEPLTLIREHPGRVARGDWDVLAATIKVFDKIVARADDPRRRRLCRRAYGRALAWVARAEAGRGELRRARTALARAYRLAPTSGRIWHAAAALALASVRRRG